MRNQGSEYQNSYINILRQHPIRDPPHQPTRDPLLKSPIYFLSSNGGKFIDIGKPGGLNLNGRFLYLQIKLIKHKHFSLYVDVTTTDDVSVRISISSALRQFRSTPASLHFPYSTCSKDDPILDYKEPRWTLLQLDLTQILSIYTRKTFVRLSSIRLYPNLRFKCAYSSNLDYVPGVAYGSSRLADFTSSHHLPLPREMNFSSNPSHNWEELFDFIRFPSDGTAPPFDSVQNTPGAGKLGIKSQPSQDLVVPTFPLEKSSTSPKTRNLSLLYEKTPPAQPALPKCDFREDGNSIHVYPSDHTPFRAEMETRNSGKVSDSIVKAFGLSDLRTTCWASINREIIFPSCGVVVCLDVETGQRRHYLSQHGSVSAVAVDGRQLVAAAGGHVMLWRFKSCQLLCSRKVGAKHLCHLQFCSPSLILAIGGDEEGNMVLTFLQINRRGNNSSLKVVSSNSCNKFSYPSLGFLVVDSQQIIFLTNITSTLTICKLRNGHLATTTFQQKATTWEFSAICEGRRHKDACKTLIVATRCGHVLELEMPNFKTVSRVKLLPRRTEKSFLVKSNSAWITRVDQTEDFLVTASADSFVRVWANDACLVEAAIDGICTLLRFSGDGLGVVVGSTAGLLGILNVERKSYKSIVVDQIGGMVAMSVDGVNRVMMTASESSVNIWGIDEDWGISQSKPTFVVDLGGKNLTLLLVCPNGRIMACGFADGSVEIVYWGDGEDIIDIGFHKDQVVGLQFTVGGLYLCSVSVGGSLAIHDMDREGRTRLKRSTSVNILASPRGTNSLALCPGGNRIAYVSRSNRIVVMDGMTLDKLVSVDIDSLAHSLGHSLTALSCCFSWEGLVVSTDRSGLLLFDSDGGELLDYVLGEGEGRPVLCFEENGGKIGVICRKYFFCYEINGGKLSELMRVNIHLAGVRSLNFWAEWTQIITLGDGVILWDFASHSSSRVGQSLDWAVDNNENQEIPPTPSESPKLPVESVGVQTEIKKMKNKVTPTSGLCFGHIPRSSLLLVGKETALVYSQNNWLVGEQVGTRRRLFFYGDESGTIVALAYSEAIKHLAALFSGRKTEIVIHAVNGSALEDGVKLSLEVNQVEGTASLVYSGDGGRLLCAIGEQLFLWNTGKLAYSFVTKINFEFPAITSCLQGTKIIVGQESDIHIHNTEKGGPPNIFYTERKISAMALVNETLLVVGHISGHMALFSSFNSHKLQQWSAHGEKIVGLDVVENKLISVDEGGYLAGWEIEASQAEGRCALFRKKCLHSRRRVVSSSISPHFISLVDDLGDKTLVDLSSFRHTRLYAQIRAEIKAVHYDGGNNVVSVATGDGHLSFHSPETLQNGLEVVLPRSESVVTADASLSGDFMALLLGDNTIKIFCLGTRSVTQTFEDIVGNVTVFKFHVDGRALLVGLEDGSVRIYSLNDFEVEKQLHTSKITDLDSSTGLMLSCGMDRLIKVWSCNPSRHFPSVELVSTIPAPKQEHPNSDIHPLAVFWREMGIFAANLSSLPELLLFNYKTGANLCRLPLPGYATCMTGCRGLLAVGTHEELVVYEDGVIRQQGSCHRERMKSIRFSPGGRELQSFSDTQILLWTVDN